MRYILLCIICLFPYISEAQKMVKYTTGTPGDADYQEITFWSDKRILYKNNKSHTEYAVQYLGMTMQRTDKAFLLKLTPELSVRLMTTESEKLALTGISANYFSLFTWSPDGPKNNKGICKVCALNETEALSVVLSIFK